MSLRGFGALKRLVLRFRRRTEGSLASTFALALIPIMTGVGAAIDYSRANAAKTFLQSTLDAALLAGAKDGSSNWTQVALNVFNSNLAMKNMSAATPTFTVDSNAAYSGSATASIPTSMLGIIRINSMDVSANASAMMAEADDSCILTLDQGQARSHVSLTLNGAPVVNLSGCSIRSNSSLACNGNDGNAMKAIASGAAGGCSRPKSNAATVPDTYTSLASNITT